MKQERETSQKPCAWKVRGEGVQCRVRGSHKGMGLVSLENKIGLFPAQSDVPNLVDVSLSKGRPGATRRGLEPQRMGVMSPRVEIWVTAKSLFRKTWKENQNYHELLRMKVPYDPASLDIYFWIFTWREKNHHLEETSLPPQSLQRYLQWSRHGHNLWVHQWMNG